jgi:hypothetical protein
MKRYAMKRDLSEPEIVTALQTAGATVYRMDTPVDLAVGYRGVTYLAECKTERKRGGLDKRTEVQARFIETWRGSPVAILYSAQDAIDWLADVSAGRGE